MGVILKISLIKKARILFKILMGNRLFFLKFGFFCSNSLWVISKFLIFWFKFLIGRSASALSWQATDEEGSPTATDEEGALPKMLEKEKKKKRNKEISKVMVFGSNTTWVIGVILKISLIKKGRTQLQSLKWEFRMGNRRFFLKVRVFWFKTLMGNRLFFWKFGVFCSKSLWVISKVLSFWFKFLMGRSARSASALSWQATDKGGSSTERA